MMSVIRFLRDEDGPSAVEYAVILALLLSAMVTAITFVGNEIHAISERNVQAIDGARRQLVNSVTQLQKRLNELQLSIDGGNPLP